ncbi:MAG: histidine--tRNA ligase [Candidatus Omnitrophica bacterium]|nr:histidine--tRNA ligase [Candidatus Omnitrophota bacterium]
MEKINSLRGMRDILPPEVYSWQFVEKAAREVFESFGYEEIRTPLLEETALFQRGIGEGTDIVNKEMYTFTDKGGRSITLRPEGTAPIVRSYVENNLNAGEDMVKLYYMGPMFRSERPQKGRSRQFYQVGIEAVGSASPYVDAEAILAMAAFFAKVGLDDFKVKLCSLGCSADKEKFAKALKEYLKGETSRLCDDCKVRLEKNVLRILDCKVESCKTLLVNSPKAKDFLCPPCAENYKKVKDIISSYGINFQEDANLVRGLDYYTSTVFEVTHPALGSQDAIAAGGRYDNLIEDFGGKKTGAFGFAVGVERLLLALSSKGEIKTTKSGTALYIAATGEDVYPEAFKSTMALRREGISCEIDFQGRSLKAQMRQANKKNAAFVAIFGDEELKRGEVVLRDMKTKEQRNVKLSELAKAVKNV